MRHVVKCCFIAVVVTGCGTLVANSHPGPSPLVRGYSTSSELEEESGQVEELTGVINLQKALSLALMNNPELTAFSLDVRAAEARELQAGLLRNPELEIEVEDFGGAGERSGFRDAESSVSLGQVIELGGKRRKRKQVAALSKQLHAWEYEAKKLDVFTETSRAFVDVLAQQKRSVLARETLELTEEMANLVSEKVDAGKVSPLEKNKAEVLLATTRIGEDNAIRELESAKRALAAYWGASAASFSEADGDLESIFGLPSLDSLIELVDQNPDLSRFGTELELRDSEVRLAKASRLPDVTIKGGVKRYEGTSDYAFVVGVSFPLGIFDRNQGGIQEAKHSLGASRSLKRSQKVRTENELISAYQNFAAAHFQATTLRNSVLPAATSALEGASEGYREGKTDYLDVLDAQRTFYDVQGQYVQSLASYHKAVIKIERLVGQKIDQEMKNAR